MTTKRFYVLGFGTLMLFDTMAQICFKLASIEAGEFVPSVLWVHDVLFSPWTYGAIAGYIGAFFTWMTLLEHAPVGPAFAASHLEVVTVLVISVLYFGEHLSVVQLFGVLLIVAGIVCMSQAASTE
jgi:drug/metabolite transporter (DMT)-like permease